MRAELLPDEYSPFRLEIAAILIPAVLALRQRLAAVRTTHEALEAQVEALVGPLKLESARLRLRLHLLSTLLSLLNSGLAPDEAASAIRRLIRLRPGEEEGEGEPDADAAPPAAAGSAKRAFRYIVSATHPDRAAAALFALAARGIDADEFLSAAITAQQTRDSDGLIALAVVLSHLAPDSLPGGGEDGLGLARHEEHAILVRAIEALQAEQVALRNSPLTAARIPGSQPPKLSAAYIERLMAQHRAAIVLLETQARQVEHELAQRYPAEFALAQEILKEYSL